MQMWAAKMRTAKKQNWGITVVGLLIALGFFSLPFGTWINESANLMHMISYELIIWTFVAVILLYVTLVERRPLSSIGFRVPGIKDGIIAVAAGILTLVCLALVYYAVFPALHWNENQQLSSLSSIPYWLNFLIVIRAAVSEEILFRGYAMERLEELSGSRSVAAVVSCTVFTLDHIGFWGWHHVFIAGLGGIVLTLLYLWRRNLWVNMLAHFIVDGAAFLL